MVVGGLDPATDSLEQVLGQVFVHLAAAEDGASAWLLVTVGFHQQHRHDPDAQAKLADTYHRWHAGLAGFVTALQQGGWVHPGRDPDVLATQIFAYTSLYQLDQPGLIDGLIRLLKEPA